MAARFSVQVHTYTRQLGPPVLRVEWVGEVGM